MSCFAIKFKSSKIIRPFVWLYCVLHLAHAHVLRTSQSLTLAVQLAVCALDNPKILRYIVLSIRDVTLDFFFFFDKGRDTRLMDKIMTCIDG